MSDFFRVEGLPAVKHTPATKDKLNTWNGNKSHHIRQAILDFANREGFDCAELENKPGFLSIEQWQDYRERQAKRRNESIDYLYLIAFRWLQHKFDDLSASVILRRAVLG